MLRLGSVGMRDAEHQMVCLKIGEPPQNCWSWILVSLYIQPLNENLKKEDASIGGLINETGPPNLNDQR